jgi:hypothetical protein
MPRQPQETFCPRCDRKMAYAVAHLRLGGAMPVYTTEWRYTVACPWCSSYPCAIEGCQEPPAGESPEKGDTIANLVATQLPSRHSEAVAPGEGVEKAAKRLAHPPRMRRSRIRDPFPRCGKGHDVNDVLCGGDASHRPPHKTSLKHNPRPLAIPSHGGGDNRFRAAGWERIGRILGHRDSRFSTPSPRQQLPITPRLGIMWQPPFVDAQPRRIVAS